MRKITVFFLLASALAWTSLAHAQLSFDADFAQDTAYEDSWPMKAGDVVSVDIYVSNVPEPGLFSMNFKLTYDPTEIDIIDAGTEVDNTNWPQGAYTSQPEDVPGERSMGGFRDDTENCPVGDQIRLVILRIQCIASGESTVQLLDRGPDFASFVLADLTVKDEDLGTGVLLAMIRPPVAGNINGDSSVDLADAILGLQCMAKMDHSYVHANGDTNGDGLIGMQEVIYILQEVSGLR